MLNRHSILIILLVSFMYSQQSLSIRPYSFENELLREEIPVDATGVIFRNALFNQPSEG